MPNYIITSDANLIFNVRTISKRVPQGLPQLLGSASSKLAPTCISQRRKMQISCAARGRRVESDTWRRFSVAHLSIVIEFALFRELEAHSPYTKLATNYKVDNKLLLILARQRVVKRMMAACIKLSAMVFSRTHKRKRAREKHPA
jgi:hypothetical protein